MARPRGSRGVRGWIITPDVAAAAGVSLTGELSKEDGDKLVEAKMEAKHKKVANKEQKKSRLTTQDVESEPWKYTADVYASVKGSARPALGEISGTQRSRMSERQKKKYDEQQQIKRKAFEAAKKEWGDKIWEAYQKGEITLDKIPNRQAGMFDLNARQLILSRISSQKKQKKENTFKALQQKNLITSSNEIKAGDRVNYRLNNKYATVIKKNKNTVKVEFEDGSRSTIKVHLLQKESYGDLQKKN